MTNRLSLNDIGCLVAVFGLAAFIPLAIICRHFLLSSDVANSGHLKILGWACLGLYAVAAILNFYLSFIRPLLHHWRGEGAYKHVSGIPIVHTTLLLAAIFTLPANFFTGLLMLLLLVLDTGAAHWAAFAVATEFLRKRG